MCDPARVLRAAVDDVYNSISGLTLFDVDGERHGWALSRTNAHRPESSLKIPLGSFSLTAPGDEKVGAGHMLKHEGDNPETTVDFHEDRRYDPHQDGDIDDDCIWAYHAPVTFAPDEPVCLRVMSCADNFDDLHALALTSRTFYAAFEQHELALMRGLVRNNRRLTLSLLSADSDGPLSTSEKGRRGDDEVLLPGEKSDMATSTTAGSEGVSSPLGRDDVYGWEVLGDQDLEGDDDDNPMTEEEACRILWPDQAPPSLRPRDSTARDATADRAGAWRSRSAPVVPGDDGGGEKFLAGELTTIVRAPEEKALVILGDKTLRGESDGRRGLASG